MSLNDWYAAVKKHFLCYGCLGNEHAIKDGKINVFRINGQWMFQEAQMKATIDESKDVFHCERFSILNKLVITVACVHRI